MKVLSLFDGISCGMVALSRIGINVEQYHAYEIDKYAIQISHKNYPEIQHHGDVFTGDFTEYRGYDLLIGGSPCTFWSIAKQGREISPDGIGGRLFLQYVRALRESEARYFLYENNYSIHQDIKDFISEQLGVRPIMINSALVSAQHRKRCYWTNIPIQSLPIDKGIVCKDILEDGHLCRYNRQDGVIKTADKTITLCSSDWRGINRDQTGNAVLIPLCVNSQSGNSNSNSTKQPSRSDRIYSIENKYPSLTNGFMCKVAQPIRLGHISKTDGQANRVYSIRWKTVSMLSSSGGSGTKTGLYKIDLPDGDYLVRKLTPVEAERCQTLPDNYTEGISDTQRYKCIGNGWTVDVIAYILSFLKDHDEISERRKNRDAISIEDIINSMTSENYERITCI
ncbi:MAG: DNA cytosine methyltransferase [Lachnospiraceae bacterium]|nr:DNA cytosine methyltransferase [Lachnospiraceae bacterium]